MHFAAPPRAAFAPRRLRHAPRPPSFLLPIYNATISCKIFANFFEQQGQKKAIGHVKKVTKAI